MALSNENNTRMVNVYLGTHIAAATVALPAYHCVNADRVKSVKLMNNAALAGDDTNNRVVTLQKVGGAAIATLTTDVASGGLVKNVAIDLPVTAPALAAGDDLEVDLAVNNTGGALTDAILQIELID